MKPLSRLLTLLLLMSAMTCLAQPVQAARLAAVDGKADASEQRDDAEFKLSDQSTIEVSYDITKLGDKCAVQVRIYRQQNGRWLMVNTPVRASNSTRGSRSLTLPAGSYRIEVVATHARYGVSVDM